MIYTLKNDSCRAVCSERGGELTSFICNNTEYIWNGDKKFWAGQAPHLFPIVCSPKDGHVIYDGVSYPMNKHGFIRGTDFETIGLSPEHVIFQTRWSKETLLSFPYRYTLRVTHTITECAFSTSYTVTSEDDMVFCIGGHPGFMCPLPGGGDFEDYELRFSNAKDAVISFTENGYMDSSLPKLDLISDNILPLRYSDFDRDAVIVENIPTKRVDLVSRINGHGIKFIFEGFDALGIWTPTGKNAPFICLEPWCGLPASVDESGNAYDKKYAIILPAGENFTVQYSAEVI